MEKEAILGLIGKKVSIILDSYKYCIKGKILNTNEDFLVLDESTGYKTKVDLRHIVAISEEE